MAKVLINPVASKAWRWAPGMCLTTGRVLTPEDFPVPHANPPWEPDVEDPGTKGHMLQRLRDICGQPHIHVEQDKRDDRWYVWAGAQSIADADTEGAALAKALQDGANRPQAEKVAGAFTRVSKMPRF